MIGCSKNYINGNRCPQDWQEIQTLRGKNDLKEDVRITKINIWTKCFQNRVKWKEVVVKTKTLKNIVVAPGKTEDTLFESRAEY